MPIRPMRAGDREAVLDLLESAFSQRALFARYMDFDPAFRFDDFLLCVEGGRPVSCVQVFEKPVRLRGTPLRLGGIGSVATAPDARRRGLAGELMERQAERMRERGMPLGLLFTGRHGFYERLGWHARTLRQALLRRTPAAKGAPGRAFEPADLPAVMELYASYCATRDGTTVRDEAYWLGNLRYAGTPGEDFRVLDAGDGIAAYARGVTLSGLPALMEFAAGPGREPELASLVADLVPAEGVLVARLPADAGLERALAGAGLELSPVPDRSPMWKVLDADALRGLLGAPEAADDAALVDLLEAHYWLADRF